MAKRGWRTCAAWLAAAVGTMAAPGLAAGQTTACTEITSLPYTITSSGVYCLKQNFYTSLPLGAAITVNGGTSVVVDLGGFAINNLAGGTAAWTTGVSAVNKSNVTVRNGRIQWFRTGVALVSSGGGSSAGHAVENVHVDYAQLTGISVRGSAVRVQDCSVTRVGNVDGSGAPAGIVIEGDGNLVEGSFVSDFYSPNGRGMMVYGTNHLIVANRITNPNNYGLFLENSPTTKYRDNLVTGAAVPYAGGIDAGNNQ